ncbi:MAG: hypothetical protein MJ025_00525 [Victivallaceae bacterium]|nr:hypothetical protein [Victivallaceae bacterium]
MKGLLKKLLIVATVVAASVAAQAFPSMGLEQLRRFKAERWTVIGKNIFVKGGIHLPYGEYELYADQAVINTESGDLEAVGNIRFYRWQKTTAKLDLNKLAELGGRNDLLLEMDSSSTNEWGQKIFNVKGRYLTDTISAQRVAGNITTGYFRMDDFTMRSNTVVCRAKSAERLPSGKIILKDGEISSCNYLADDNAHYSVAGATITLTPHKSDLPGVSGIDDERGDYAVFMANGCVKIYGVPLLWLPLFYKPRDENPGLVSVMVGKRNSWEYFVSLSRLFKFEGYPGVRLKLRGDYYNMRGFGYGGHGSIALENSRTDFFAYAISDMRPNLGIDYRQYRFRIPHDRYDFRISNITHLTPRLDFRAAFEYASDPYVTHDFFNYRYSNNREPATFIALEQQFDHFSASIYYRPRVNNFYNTVEKVPEVRLDIHRQELFHTNIYYQGTTTAAYNQMRWLKFDLTHKEYYHRKHKPYDPILDSKDLELSNYQAFKMDTTHFLYYPIRTKWFTLTPRAGLKFLVYSHSSKNDVSNSDVNAILAASQYTNTEPILLNQYDNQGGAQLRLIGELGFELSTKIHNTWQGVRNKFMGIDGLRHIIKPYINYTYLDVLTGCGIDNLYYFDDVDRIERQHFIRFGLENRLQTRDGGSIREILSMENFIDVHFERGPGVQAGKGTDGYLIDIDRMSRLGDFCTLLTVRPLKNLSISTAFSINFTNQNGSVPDTIRNGRNVGKKGLQASWLNKWSISIAYEPIDDVKINFAYTYHRPYAARTAYSMGSTLTNLEAGSFFNKVYTDYTETLSFSVNTFLTPDRRTFGSVGMTYDIQKGNIDDITIAVTRQFHCLEVAAMLEFSRENDRDGAYWDTSFSIQAQLLGLENPFGRQYNDMLDYANETLRAPNHRLF